MGPLEWLFDLNRDGKNTDLEESMKREYITAKEFGDTERAKEIIKDAGWDSDMDDMF